MEEEARTILRDAVEARQPDTGGQGLGHRIQAHFAALGGVELELPERSSPPAPTLFVDEPPTATQAPANREGEGSR